MKKGVIITIVVVLIVALGGIGYFLHTNAVADTRESSIQEIEKFAEKNQYRPEEQKKIDEILSAYREKINQLKEKEAFSVLIDEAKKEIGTVKTEAEYVEEERIAEEKRKEEERIAEEKKKEEERIAEEKRKEEERIAEEKQAAEQSQSSSGNSNSQQGGTNSGGSSNSSSEGCVTDDAENFY